MFLLISAGQAKRLVRFSQKSLERVLAETQQILDDGSTDEEDDFEDFSADLADSDSVTSGVDGESRGNGPPNPNEPNSQMEDLNRLRSGLAKVDNGAKQGETSAGSVGKASKMVRQER